MPNPPNPPTLPSALIESPPAVNDRRLNVLLGAAIVTAVGMIVFALIAVPKIVDSSRTTDAIARSSDIGGCRSTYRVQVDQGVAGVLVAKSRLDEATNAGLEYAITDDDERLVEIVGSLPGLRAELEKRVTALERAVESYDAAVDLSIADPERFLAECNGRLS